MPEDFEELLRQALALALGHHPMASRTAWVCVWSRVAA